MTGLRPYKSARLPGVFDDLRRDFETVTEQARHVAIRHDRLAAYAAALPGHRPFNLLDTQHHFTGGAEETAAYILTLDAINFGSGYKSLLAAEGWPLLENSIYFTLSTKLKERFEGEGPLTAVDLSLLTVGSTAILLNLGEGPASAAFAMLCTRSLNDLGRLVLNAYGGSFLALADSAQGSAEYLVETLIKMESFRDVSLYRGQKIAFYKRAQITAADLHLAFGRLGRELFNDTGRLTMFADNAVPHVLHVDGLLEYAPELAARIAAGEEIPAGSAEEIEIRACAAQAVELLAAATGKTAMETDHILWHRSGENPRYADTPTHRTLTWFY